MRNNQTHARSFSISRLTILVFLLLFPCVGLASPLAATDRVVGSHASRGALYGDLLAGQYADRSGHQRAAAHYFIAALQQNPSDRALLARGFVASLIADSPDRYTLARRLPDSSLGALMLGDYAMLNGTYSEARAKFVGMPLHGPLGLLRPLLIAWSDEASGHTDRAISMLYPLTNTFPFGSIYALHAALIADLADREAQAAKYYRLAEQGGGESNLILAQILASWQARQGNNARAEEIITRTATDHPALNVAINSLKRNLANPIITTPRAGVALAEFEFAGELSSPDQIAYPLAQLVLLDEALTLDPRLSPAILLRASIAEETGNAPLAEHLLRSIPPTDSLYPIAVMRRAALAADFDSGLGMLPDLHAIAIAAPQDAAPLELAADIASNAKRYSEAKELYTKAIGTFGPNPPESAWRLYFGRAISEDKLDNWPAAKADLHQALALAPDQADVLNYLGYSEAIRGEDLRGAQKLVQQAVQALPEDGQILDSLGYILLKRGMIADALAVQIKAAEHAPDDPEVNAHLAEIFDAAGNHLAAFYQWRRALALHPDPRERAKIEAALKHDSIPSGI